MGKFLVNPETNDLIPDDRGALYLVDDQGNASLTEQRFKRVRIGYQSFTPNLDMEEMLRSFFSHRDTALIDIIVGYTFEETRIPGGPDVAGLGLYGEG